MNWFRKQQKIEKQAVEFECDFFNAGGRAGGDRCKASQGQRSRWLSCQLKPQSLSGMLVAAGNGEKPNRQDKNKYADHQKQKTVHRKKITNDGGGCFYADGRNEPSGAKLSKKLSESPKLPFLFLLFFRDKRYAYTQKYYAEESYPYPQKEREIFEKITRNGDCHDRFTKVGNHFSDEFPAFVADDNHRLNNNMLVMGCQEECLSGARP